MKKQKVKRGPFCYENWKSFLQGEEWQEIYEYPLFSDNNDITSEVVEGLGPHEIINNVAMQPDRPKLTLRITQYIPFESLDMGKRQTEQYHGGTEAEEIAALIALCLGIRLKSGGYNRVFSKQGDPRGRPVAYGYSEDPYLAPRKHKQSRPILNSALLQSSLEEAKILATLPKLSIENVTILVRAARMYQEALWIVESMPELSWLMLVSSVETVANRWRKSIFTPIEKMRVSRPNLEPILRKYAQENSDKLVEKVANEIADYMGATKTFRDFILEYLPPPPLLRPPPFAQVDWEDKPIKKALEQIYSYRSNALHGGQPFPAPMCYPPFYVAPNGAAEEKSTGLAIGMKGSVWLAKDVPMSLQTFEYITRNCILNWWKALAEPT